MFTRHNDKNRLFSQTIFPGKVIGGEYLLDSQLDIECSDRLGRSFVACQL